ncbi:hypothetical protein JF50_17970 [Pseudoalteromonas luteoviolacea]|uniref:Uncharacterized protein n=1 Tax=Pseudoalteromonas luteoviolacea TaxID=43657 RepID=A0A0C1QM97_9GAMM|nr:hypothetical protein JF50_17970 [Pseudoalteromonas luteoviolacea]
MDSDNGAWEYGPNVELHQFDEKVIEKGASAPFSYILNSVIIATARLHKPFKVCSEISIEK